ncbi:MAG TPA: non-homologous end-joining DNA ligase [Candidatus Didemnitutus sp.]|nr:non-homologous end-joining DNA ligase [Candidatus Didemnitutus sp.]
MKPAVKFSNLDKVFFPRTGFTKGEMIQYYVSAAPCLLPHLAHRPVTLIRYPDGITGEKFYEKNAPPFAPPWLATVAVARRHTEGHTNYIVIDNVRALAWCANLAAIEIHPFLHRVRAPTRPTQVVFDLDPGEGADLVTCARVAFLVKEIADRLGLQLFPKVSGSKGLQLYVPLNTPVTYAATSAFAKSVAEHLEQEHPELVVSRMAKARRRRRVMIDWSQNNASKTTVAAYSLRGKRDVPTVSMPVTWNELKRLKKSSGLLFSPQAALARMRKLGDLFAPVLTLKQKLPKAFSAMKSAQPAPLARYAAKRDFTATAEPKATARLATGRKANASEKRGRRFVVQKHAASHLHYDFRLEMDGTLKSWAVPKGVPTEAGVKHSAFAVEDHPMAYMKFEGTIPKGQYGGGTVMVWDLGTYNVLSGSFADGRMKIHLEGKKLRGDWSFFRIRSGENGKDVWLITPSGAVKPISAAQDDRSVLSRRSMSRIAKDNDRQWQSSRR